jgi:acyl-CoA synthetase (AMP-forming)/AMP-acid ligase II/alkylation response protein AidB-like acyl-CoA dehydrogenase/acyl carrier protein
LAQRARALPNAAAFTFLRDGEEAGETLTFGQLHQRSLALGEQLSRLHPLGSRAILLDPLGLDFFIAFFGCLYAGFIPVPVSLPSRQRGASALRRVAADSGAACLLTSSSLLSKFASLLASDEKVAALGQIAVDKCASEPSVGWVPPPAKADDILLLQYTSGTTDSPRGVMVTHANMLHNQQQIEHGFDHDENTVIVSWLPLFHDMGLGSAMQAIWLGVHCVLMSPSAFIQKPLRWLSAISRYRATTSGGPDFAYELCVRQIDPADCSELDLSSWTGAFNGSEPVRPATLDRFAAAFGPFGFSRSSHRSVYGLAEATLLVTTPGPGESPVVRQFTNNSPRSEENPTRQSARALASCGRPWLGTRVVIVDPETREICRPGREGEIWVGGQSVGAGYWQKPAETEQTFQARTAQGDGPFLRTGDLGFLEGSGLFVTGRLKDLIIIRGENHYPQDIEATVAECHPSLEPQRCAAFAIDGEDGEQLVIVQEVKRTALRHLETEDVFRAIRGAVSRGHSLYTGTIVLVRPATLPRTSSGKVQRKACAKAFEAKSLAQVAAWSPPIGPVRESQIPADGDSSRSADRLIAWVRKNVPERLGWSRQDERDSLTHSLVLELGKQGLLGMQVDRRHGGLGLGHLDAARVLEQLAAIDLGLCLFVALNNALGMQVIAAHGTEELKSSLLPRLLGGSSAAGFAFMEPGGGNAPSTFSAVARADVSGRWRLFGTKCLHGQNQRANVVNVFVRHEESPAVSAFVLTEDMPGMHIAQDGFRLGVVGGMAQDTVVLDGVLVDPSHLLGNVGAGMDVARQAMLQTRFATGAACLGTMKRCAQLARRHSPYSGRIEGKLTPNPVTLSRFGSLAARVTTLGTFIQKIAVAMDAGEIVPAEAFAVCKVAAPELLLRAADDLMQVGAQRGAEEMQRLSLLYSQAGFLRTLDGPPEPVSELLGGLLLEGDGKSLKALIVNVLGAPNTLPMLDRIVVGLRQRLQRSSGALTRRAQRWSHTRAGELISWVVLVASVEGAHARAPTAELSRALSWSQAQFEFALSTVELSSPAELSAMDAADVAEAFAAYAHTIGDLEDPYSQESSDPPAPMGYWEPLTDIHPVSRRSSPAAAAPPGRVSKSELMEFISSWLSRRLRLTNSRIDRTRSFADHGLDSMAAVELAKALSDRLGRPLDETLLWNFATIDDLVAYLDQDSHDAHPPAKTVAPAAPSAFDSTDEVEAELTRELARLELELKRR